MHGFKRIIQKIDIKAKVLDAGAWGLDGENTSQHLEERFSNVTFMNIKSFEKVTLVADFYKYKFKEKFDLIVLDMPQKENKEKDWTDPRITRKRVFYREKALFG